MEPRTDRILLPKHIYNSFLQQCIERYPDTEIVKIKARRKAVPYELHTKDGTVLLTYDRWFNMMVAFFDMARQKIVEGERLSMFHAGFIHAKRIERNFANKRINWKATIANGKKWDEQQQRFVPVRKVYHTGEDYCRIGWSGKGLKEAKFKFVPTHSSKHKIGFRQQFSQALIENPDLKLVYIYYPYKYF